MPTFEKIFKKSGKEDNMKCQFCNKNIDEVDTKCNMCTICGWKLDEVLQNLPPVTLDKKDTPTPSTEVIL